MHFKIVYITAKKGLALKNYCIRNRTCLLNWIKKSSKLVLNNTWLNQTKINMDPERMIISAEASGFPKFMREVLKNMDFEDLLKSRLVSMTFYKFLINQNQRKLWIGAASKSDIYVPKCWDDLSFNSCVILEFFLFWNWAFCIKIENTL